MRPCVQSCLFGPQKSHNCFQTKHKCAKRDLLTARPTFHATDVVKSFVLFMKARLAVLARNVREGRVSRDHDASSHLVVFCVCCWPEHNECITQNQIDEELKTVESRYGRFEMWSEGKVHCLGMLSHQTSQPHLPNSCLPFVLCLNSHSYNRFTFGRPNH